MVRRQVKIATPDPDAPGPAPISQTRQSDSGQSDTGQFWLQVDRQTKASYVTFEAAEQAGLRIKQAHPAIQVTVFDTIGGDNKILESLKS